VARFSFISPRLGVRALFALCALALAFPGARAAVDDDRIIRLNDEIKALEVVVESAKDADEKARLQPRLQSLRQERAILVERQMIEAQQRALSQDLATSPLDSLREKLRGVDRTVEEGEARLQGLVSRRKKASLEREALGGELESLRAGAAANKEKVAELEEALFTKNEELRSLALEREAAEDEIEVAREAERLRKSLRDSEADKRPTLRRMFESYNRLNGERKTDTQLDALAANLEQNLKISQGSLDLAQQKLARFDDELALLEKQAAAARADPQVERLLVNQRAQKKATADRLPFIASQVEAIRRALQAVRTRQELIASETIFLQERYVTMRQAYVHRLRWPGFTLGGLLGLYLLTIYLLLPLRYKNEGLFLARRLTRYFFFLLATGVFVGFMFEDLTVITAALGVVSAALVISLKDVCTSVFGWLVIMAGRKFDIGDRLEIEGTRGDVLDIEVLRTTLLEVNGWLGSDQPTGRVITIPNHFIFTAKVFNFTHGHPFIWGKVDLTVTFATPVATAMALFDRVLREETREQFAAAQSAASAMHDRYGVEDAVYKPKIYTQITENGVMFSLFYVANYREFSNVRNQLNRRLIANLETHPNIQIHKGNVTPGGPTAVLGSDYTSPPFAMKAPPADPRAVI
jgi:small-conductance mechanosensitive channel